MTPDDLARDMTRMEWPGEQKPPPALPGGWRLADHPEYGRGIVTNTTPDAYGDIYFAFPSPEEPTGYELRLCEPDELTLLGIAGPWSYVADLYYDAIRTGKPVDSNARKNLKKQCD